MEQTKKLILLDADILIHLTKGERINLLYELFPNRLLILDEVLHELVVYPAAKQQLQNMILFQRIKQYEVPKNIVDKVITEYSRIKKSTPSVGIGEGYCMAIAKLDNKIIASSNLRDIKIYCEENKIEYITTMDILQIAYTNGLMSETDCDYFIYTVTSKGSRLPFSTITAFIASKK